MCWTVETLNAAVDKEIDALPADLRARFVRISKLIAEVGLIHVGAPYTRHLRDELWEMRMSGKDRIARALYVAVHDKRVVVVRVFIKKARKTPAREIELALRRARRYIDEQARREQHR